MSGVSAPETPRRLIRTIRTYQHGHLQDDAAVLLVDWHSNRERRMVLSRNG